ncbi:uncharacterized protein PGTG_13813 [Puccinia graminis f. sp. tritici CRL 75-36-700-3]|uniref:Uncharacterized protein n=1 Tax=Puccinia graminis f. sp. tritici (strain CRL 75-36-700-3 / race SCCL) TaxID=418459 RepID=E3KUQ9_PUCGT|nr:uncharacterized protein PGTG_13813 [Puccinia graminis f. sp. tritici CRL 75-36-700-3]EFP88009.1 hypothetical protein PGTG_13813 [Puccinia graminis f. sp. tritici CRL 75-36-700-3]
MKKKKTASYDIFLPPNNNNNRQTKKYTFNIFSFCFSRGWLAGRRLARFQVDTLPIHSCSCELGLALLRPPEPRPIAARLITTPIQDARRDPSLASLKPTLLPACQVVRKSDPL